MAEDEMDEEELLDDVDAESPDTDTSTDEVEPLWEQPSDAEPTEPVLYRTVEFTYIDGSTTQLINVDKTISGIRKTARRNHGWYGGGAPDGTCSINLKYVRYMFVVETYDTEKEGYEPPFSQDLR